jgi:hypothetical protein
MSNRSKASQFGPPTLSALTLEANAIRLASVCPLASKRAPRSVGGRREARGALT